MSVTRIVTVIQGGSVDLRGAFRLHNNSSSSFSDCEVRQLSQDLCAEVYPRTFPCNYAGAVRFYHLGCRSSYETVNLQLLYTSGEEIIAEIFSVPVHISIPEGAKPETSFDQKSMVLSLWFPTSLIGICSYTVVHNHSSLPLPLLGHLTGGIIGQPLPCGLSPRDPLIYTALEGNATDDFLLVRVDCLEKVTHYVLPIGAGVHSAPPVEQLLNVHLDVHELNELPVSPSLLPLDRLHSYPSSKLKITFPVLNIGGLYPITAAHNGALDATTFSLLEFQQWRVIFRPNESSSSRYMIVEDTFYYHVTDGIGNTIAKGSLLVKLHPKTDRRPSVRSNTGIAVRHQGTSPLTSSNLSFYQIHICPNATLRLEQAPSYGSFVLAGNSIALKMYSAISASVLRNGSLLYSNEATTHRTVLIDFSLWSLECVGHSVLKIPVVIHLLPPPTSCHLQRHNLAILALQYTATPLPALSSATGGNSRIIVSTSTGLVLKPQEGCAKQPFSNSSSYPFVHISDLNLTACQPSKILELNTLGPVAVWFLPLGNKSATVTISTTLSGLDMNRTRCTTTTTELTIQVQNTSLGALFTPQQSRENVPTPDVVGSTLPNLIHNHPIPLTSKDSVVITAPYLYIDPQGHLQNKIFYQVKTPPQHGNLCLVYMLHCTRSIPAFTQADILANRLYYKQNSSFPLPMDDWFEFTFYTFNAANISAPHNFTIRRSEEVLTKPLRQFWVARNSSKPLAPKFLRHTINQLTGNDIRFTVIGGPKHGWLETPNSGSSFHLRESKARNVTYHHNGDLKCADSIFLEATDGQKTVAVNISVAVRRRSGSLPDFFTGNRLLQDSSSFVFSQQDLRLRYHFCPEFVLFEAVQLPGYGIVRVHDAKSNVMRHLEVNGTFSGTDIQEGLVSYFLTPELAIPENTTDLFQMKVKEPGQRMSKNVRRSTSGIFRFEIFIIPGEGSGGGQTINLTTNSPKWLTQLDNNRYGTVFGPEDLRQWNEEIEPYEILIHVSQQPLYGQLKRGPVPVGEFTLEDVYNGLISYESTITHQDRSVTGDEFRFTMIIDLEGTSHPTRIVKKFELLWCYFYITDKWGSERELYVEESAEKADFIVRYASTRKYLSNRQHPLDKFS